MATPVAAAGMSGIITPYGSGKSRSRPVLVASTATATA